MKLLSSVGSIGKLCLEFYRRDRGAIKLADTYNLSPAKTLVVIAEDDDEVNYYAMAHLDEYVASIYAQEALLFTSSKFVEQNAKNLSKNIAEIIFCGEREIEEILSYYRLGCEYVNFISLCRPEENTADGLVGASGITKEDLICYCNYRLFRYETVSAYEDFLHE